MLPDKWWLSFNDPVLNKLIEEALTGNLNFLTAWDRLTQAQAVVRREGAALFPVVDGQAGASTTLQRDGNENFGNNNSTRTSRNDLLLGLIAAYEVDLWGRIRSIRDAAALDMRATEEELQAAAITLSAEVASTWYELVTQYGQIELLKSQLKTNTDVLELVTLRFRRGQVGATDVLQQRQLVESRRGEIATAESRVAVLQHELAILLGKQPKTQVAPAMAELIQLPSLPDTGLPATLIRQRPDIRQAYYQVLSADRLVAAAIADRFPSLSLVAQVNASEETVENLFDNWLANIAANLLAPIFDAGARKAEVDRNRAVTSERLKVYGQVILVALGEVENALVQERKQRELITSLEKQLELSSLAIERVRDIYIKGAVDYLRVLDVLLTHQELQRNHLEARLQLIRFRINLCRALGGGWQMSPPELMTLGKGSETKSGDNSM
ncbi:MAG TPA: efflux transporter outer membrane subunit [Thermodesulfobacteriota bacterium]|nr:efflux transporter outer membrane subunit [Thermodesulfobacteriota bacterium]